MSRAEIEILVVDADERSASLLEGALQEGDLTVRHACSLGEADHLLGMGPVDVLVLDTSIGVGGVRELLELIAEREETASIGRVVLSDIRDPAFKLELFEAGIEEFIQKPLYMREVVARVKLVRERVLALRQVNLDRGRDGELGPNTLLELVRSIEESRRSGAIRLTAGALVGTLYFQDGLLHDAVSGRDRGVDAFFRLFTWTGGHWELRFTDHLDRERTLNRPQDTLLNDAVLHEAEFSARASGIGDLHRVFTVDYRSFATQLGALPAETNTVIRMFDGFRTLAEAVALSDASDLLALDVVRALLEQRVLIELDRPAGKPPQDDDFERFAEGPSTRRRANEQPTSAQPVAPAGSASRSDLTRAEQLRREAEELARSFRDDLDEPPRDTAPRRQTHPGVPRPVHTGENGAVANPEADAPRRQTRPGGPRPGELDAAAADLVSPSPSRQSAVSEPFPVLPNPGVPTGPDAARTGRRVTQHTDSFVAHRSGAFRTTEVDEQDEPAPEPVTQAPDSTDRFSSDRIQAFANLTASPDKDREEGPPPAEDDDLDEELDSTAAPAHRDSRAEDDEDDEDFDDDEEGEDHDGDEDDDAEDDEHEVIARARAIAGGSPTVLIAGPASSEPSVNPSRTNRLKSEDDDEGWVSEDTFFREPERSKVSPLLWIIIAAMIFGSVALYIYTDDKTAPDTEEQPTAMPVEPTTTEESVPGEDEAPAVPDGQPVWGAPQGGQSGALAQSAGENTAEAVALQGAATAEAVVAPPAPEPEPEPELEPEAEPAPSPTPATRPTPEPPAPRPAPTERRTEPTPTPTPTARTTAPEPREQPAPAPEPSGPSAAEQAVDACQGASRARNWSEALARCEEAFRMNPRNSGVLVMLGEAAYATDDQRRAISLMERAVRMDRRNARAWLTLGMARQDTGDRSGAADAYARFVELAPNSRRADEIRAVLETLR